jgi:hypothetical protein
MVRASIRQHKQLYSFECWAVYEYILYFKQSGENGELLNRYLRPTVLDSKP